MLSEKIFTNALVKAGITVNGPNAYDIRLYDENLFSKLLMNPSLAAGEGYMRKSWDCDQLDELFFRICRSQVDQEITSNWFKLIRSIIISLFNLQTKMLSKRVANQHYNLGNEFYRLMLGPTMAYTCAYWKNAETLDQAQYNKFELICKKINLKKGERVLDLGCGWGTLAKYMAERYHCQVVAVNISSEQVKYGQEINQDLPVKVVLADYRDDEVYNPKKIPFDKVVSVGLCEHVGFKNYRGFMELVKRNLRDDGLFLLHTIGGNVTNPFVDPWTEKYIFPGGMLPSIKQLAGACEELFVVEDLHNFGSDYDKTLMGWYHNFKETWPSYLAKHQNGKSFNETFYRMWSYYLLSCAGAFRARAMQLWQFVLSPKGVLGGYDSVR